MEQIKLTLNLNVSLFFYILIPNHSLFLINKTILSIKLILAVQAALRGSTTVMDKKLISVEFGGDQKTL